VLVIDDVITAGTAIRESIDLILAAGAVPAGVVLALDRQERGAAGALSAVQEVGAQFGIPVIAILTLADLIDHLSLRGAALELSGMTAYRERYGLAE
jgi:orotate phosphoribosyltransferase